MVTDPCTPVSGDSCQKIHIVGGVDSSRSVVPMSHVDNDNVTMLNTKFSCCPVNFRIRPCPMSLCFVILCRMSIS